MAIKAPVMFPCCLSVDIFEKSFCPPLINENGDDKWEYKLTLVMRRLCWTIARFNKVAFECNAAMINITMPQISTAHHTDEFAWWSPGDKTKNPSLRIHLRHSLSRMEIWHLKPSYYGRESHLRLRAGTKHCSDTFICNRNKLVLEL